MVNRNKKICVGNYKNAFQGEMQNATETANLLLESSQEDEDVGLLALAIKSLRWVSLTSATVGIAGNVLTYLTASRLGTVTSGTAFMKCLSCLDSLAAFTCGIMPSGFAMLGQKFLTLNNYTCKFGRFLTWTTVIWGKIGKLGIH